MMSIRSAHSRRTVPTQRFAIEFARGADSAAYGLFARVLGYRVSTGRRDAEAVATELGVEPTMPPANATYAM
jgi:hypothetical protein